MRLKVHKSGALKGAENPPSLVHTSVTSVQTASKATIRASISHSLEARQSRAIELYEHLDYSPENRKSDWIKKCRKVAWFSRHKVTGEVRLCFDCCRLRWCVLCGSARVSWIVHSVSDWLKTLDRPKFLTLTIRHSNADLSWQITNLYRFFKNLRRNDRWNRYVRGGEWNFQIKFSEKTKQYHNHLHCLLDSDYYPQGELSNDWTKVTGGSFIVDIRKVHNAKKAANDAARYAACPCDLSKLTTDQVLEVYHALHGRRMCGTFGSAKGVPLKPPKDPDVKLWENVGSRSLVESLKDTDDRARAILFCYHMGTSLPEGVSLSLLDNWLEGYEPMHIDFTHQKKTGKKDLPLPSLYV